MKYRELGRTGWKVSEISFGAWAIGGSWGQVDDRESLVALHKAVDLGVNFFDTADVYGDGHSERLLAKLRKERGGEIIIATKAGRRLNRIRPPATTGRLNRFCRKEPAEPGDEAIDLLQLHCPPTEVYTCRRSSGSSTTLVAGETQVLRGKCGEGGRGPQAIEYRTSRASQIIFNIFRQRRRSCSLPRRKSGRSGSLARVPLASGLLTGKFTKDSRFEADDHRHYNRQGEAFDRGETFAGLDFGQGLRAVAALKEVCPEGMSLAQFALKWILMFDAVTCAIPGAKRPGQVEENLKTVDLPPLSTETMAAVKTIYEQQVKAAVHHYW